MTSAHAVVVVVLRGGADGLSLVAPLFEDAYARARPTLSLSEDHADAARRAVAIKGGFGLHPGLAELAPWLDEGSLSIVVGAGSDDDTRSHFEAQDRIELGQLGDAGTPSSGWIARALMDGGGAPLGPLAAVAIGRALPESLRGAPATVVADLAELVDGAPSEADLERLLSLYEADDDTPRTRALAAGARSSIASLRTLRGLADARAPHADEFPKGDFGDALRTAALLLSRREELGVRFVSVDQGGWDTHFGQAPLLASNARELASGIAALRASAGDDWARTTVVVMTEFGRRVGENVSLGTDHGRASVAFLAGGALPWAPLLGRWPTMEALEGPGDLPVTTLVRDVCAEVLRARVGLDASRVFEGPVGRVQALG